LPGSHAASAGHTKSRMTRAPTNCTTLVGSGSDWPTSQLALLTQCMVRPCVASGFAELAVSGLASMYPAFDWSICSGPSWISARVRSHYRTGLDWTIWVTSVRMRREDRTSISSHPLADLGWKLLIGLCHRLLLLSRSSFVRAKGRSFVPARRTSIASRARGGQGRPSRLACGWLRRCQAAP
jgi:hypothetical protein